MKIRVQRREYDHLSNNPYRRVMAWSAWKTIASFDAAGQGIIEARQLIDQRKRRGGLVQYRIMQGKQVLA